MSKVRSEALSNLLEELEGFELNLNQYYDDAEPQSIIDSHLSGKLEALAHYCQAFGWSELAETIDKQLPLRCSAQETLSVIQGYVLPEIRHLVEQVDVDSEPAPTDWFWNFVHPRVKALAQPRFEAGFFGDAVEASFKEVNDSIKRFFAESEGREADGAGLMNTAFSPNNPVIKLAELDSETGRNIQQGYMQIFAGAMTGIRNPKAHGNLNPDSRKALHLIALASLLMCKTDERI
ncbi:TIGR02391 family protein [Marinobacter pelagius]|uniref:TIGR02391 family protein n=1 Tax=Marinobacter pelagius TaxID=379482 RepID=A0A1I4US09_9GAMM|nr:TIGR02391 family protein [Marinobacter pelagius]SFM91777.1 TIGR02391 family protein [Marinobacter pelagius]